MILCHGDFCNRGWYYCTVGIVNMQCGSGTNLMGPDLANPNAVAKSTYAELLIFFFI